MRMAACFLALAGAALAALPGKDLQLSYRSTIDGTDQPYRVYVPSSYDGTRPIPLVLMLHGTNGNQDTVFDDPRYVKYGLTGTAEKHGVLLVSPHGRGTTEYRGIGENDIFCVLEDVRNRYRIDPDRIYTTGHSMGGTGSAYLALHHPDVFAGVVAFAAAYSFPWLANNAQHVPHWWIGGANDEGFYKVGVAAGVERMKTLRCPVRFTSIPGVGHFEPVGMFDEAVSWLLEHKRVARPAEYVFEVDTPLHGDAWQTSVRAMTQPGRMAMLRFRTEGRRAAIEVENVAEFALFAGPASEVTVNGARVYGRAVPEGKELLLTRAANGWKTRLQPRRPASLSGYRTHPVATTAAALTMDGTEAQMANWIADAMRAATGADVALYNRQHYRGLPIPAGTVDIVDLVQASRPFDQYLVTVELRGRELVEIFDANCTEPNRLVQLSGARYEFDPARPAGERITATDVEPERVYKVALEGQVVERETILLAGRFGKIQWRAADVPFTLALYGHAARTGRIAAAVEGRVKQNRGQTQ